MGGNEVYNLSRQFFLLCHFYTAFYVVNDDLGTLFVGQVSVGVESVGLVFGKIHGGAQFPDIVVHGGSSYEQRVAAYFVNGFLSQIASRSGVLEGAGGCLCSPAACGVGGVAQLDRGAGGQRAGPSIEDVN